MSTPRQIGEIMRDYLLTSNDDFAAWYRMNAEEHGSSLLGIEPKHKTAETKKSTVMNTFNTSNNPICEECRRLVMGDENSSLEIKVEQKTSIQMPPPPQFSFFKHPIQNTKAFKTITPEGAYKYIKGHYAKDRTEYLRSLTDPRERSAYKCQAFDIAVFAGVFVTRKAGDLVKVSHLMVLDFDHIPDRIDELKEALPKDDHFETVLLFRSPSGDGLKWVIGLDPNALKSDGTLFTHQELFNMVSFYLKKVYNLEADPSGKDICRACFLPHDPDVVFNPFYADIV